MKIRSFLLAGLVAIGFTACNDVNEQLGPNDQGKDVKGYLSITLQNSPVKSTRTAPGSEGTVPGDDDKNESKINSIEVVLTDDAGKIKQIINSATFSGGVSEPFEVTTGSYRLYTLVNKPSEVTTVEDGNIQDVIDISSSVHATSGFNSGNFFMVNQKHDQATNAGVPVTITSANSINNPARSTVNVDRVAVKIVPSISTPSVSITTNPANVITGVNIEGYLLLNVNKQFNLIQEWGTANTNYANYTSAGAPSTVTEALQTPLFSTGLIKTQYFHNISEYTTLHKDDVDNPKTITSIEDLTIVAGFPFLAMDAPVYATENRPTIMLFGKEKPTAGRAETTAIIYKTKAVGPSGTFFVYNGRIYTDRNELNAAYAATADISTISDLAILRAKGIKVYENGVMYYTYYIKGTNKNANHQFNNENYYGVFRNSVYKLTVNSISDLGDDVPGGGTVDPEDPNNPNPPIDTEKAYIQVTVNVNDWVLNTIGIEF